MIALFQRVKYAKLRVANQLISEIQSGLIVFIGIQKEDSLDDMKKTASKISRIRLFEDPDRKMNLPLSPEQDLLLVSQFTLLGTVKGCHRPDFGQAEKAEPANILFEKLLTELRQTYKLNVKTGVFGEDMQIETLLDGPVTIQFNSKE
jgi:D-tyrosyl-tRNA(Tyr) deacylase